MNAFAVMVDAQFEDPHLSVDATYRAGGTGDPQPVRIQWSSPEAIVGVGAADIDLDAILLKVRLSEVTDPQEGDTFEFEDELVAVTALPKTVVVNSLSRIDAHRLVRTLEVGEAS